MKVKVERRHIVKGKRSLNSCPVALAVEEAGGYELVSVDSEIIHLWSAFGNRAARTPTRVARFIRKFDELSVAERKKLSPFSFILREE